MTSPRKTWFLSDCHLDAAHPEITNQFIELMKKSAGSVDDIYILGDLFELWIGDDDHSPFHTNIINSLQQAARHGAKLHFLRGNRDFLIGRRFLQSTDCQLLHDEEKINVYGTPVLVMHGDTLCTRDVAYLRARRFAYNPFIQTLFLWLPISVRRKIAARARQASKQHTRTTDIAIMDVTQTEVERVMMKHHVDMLVHGHTHRPDTHHFTVGTDAKTRIVLPAWHGGGCILEWRDNGDKEYIHLGNVNA
jgi:UDP-2,3-diacylglucosamine hydrolase